MKQPIKEIQAYLDYGDGTINDSNDLISFKISCDSGLCKSAMRKLEAKYLGEHNILGKWVKAFYGVRLPDNTFEFLDYGSFLVTELTVTKDTETTSIVAYDKMVNAMTPYGKLNIEYPVSLIDYTGYLCDACSLELGNGVIGTNRVPSFNSSLWEFSNGAFVNNDGNLELPNLKSTAKVRFNWNKKDSHIRVQFILVSGGNYRYNLTYYDENGVALSSNGNATTQKKEDYSLAYASFGGDNEYGEALQNAKYIELTFVRNSTYAPDPYVVKDIMADNYLDPNESSYKPYNPMNDWQITQELWENIEGITYRDIFVQIAQATGTTCVIGNDDKVYFKSLTDTNETLTYDNMLKLKLETQYGEINSVVLSRAQLTGEDVFMRDEDSIKANGLTEFKIESNEIIDKDRENAIEPIFNQLKGISYYPFEATTEGLGWYEIADNIDIVNDAGEVFKTSLFNYTITVDGSIKETLKTTAETKTQTQYQYASSISKRIKNTEIIVNKQEGIIQSIVSDLEGVDEQFTKIEQDVEKIVHTVQTSGGYNLIKNSVMLGYDSDNKPYNWELRGGADIKMHTDTESLAYGCQSGHSFTLSGGNKTIRQTVYVNGDGKTPYSFSVRVKKPIGPKLDINIVNKDLSVKHVITLAQNDSAYYDEYVVEGLTSNESEMVVLFTYADNDWFEPVTITDCMFAQGEKKRLWSQADGELMNTQVNINIDGITVKSTKYAGDYTVMSPIEFAGWSNASGTPTKVFCLNRDVTEIEKLKAKAEITMSPIKVIPMTSGDRQGWAFVPVVEV